MSRKSFMSESSREEAKSFTGLSTSSLRCNKTVKLRKIKKQGFCAKWLQVPAFKSWLIESSDMKVMCGVCNNKPLRARLNVLKDHNTSKGHLLMHRILFGLAQPINLDFTLPANEECEEKLQCAEQELEIVSMVVENNIPCEKIGAIVNVFKKYDPILSKIQVSRTRCQMLTVNVIGEQSKKGLAEILRNTIFSISIDESTDISKEHVLVIEVRWMNFDAGKIESAFWDLCPIFKKNVTASSSALSIFECLKNSFEKFDVSMKNIYAVSFDGCSTMNGDKQSVKVHLNNEIPNVITVRCPAHLTHLSAKYGLQELPENFMPLFKHINKMLRSPHKSHNFDNLQSEMNCRGKIVSYHEIRWLSLEATVVAILNNYEPLFSHAQELQKKQDKSGIQVYKQMQQPATKCYFYLIKKITWELNCLNKLLQSNDVIIHILWEEIEKHFKNIFSIIAKKEAIYNASFLDINIFNEESYLPYKDFLIDGMEKEIYAYGDGLIDFYQRAFNIVIGVAFYFQNNFRSLNTTLLKSIECLRPENALSQDYQKDNPTIFDNLKKCFQGLLYDSEYSDRVSNQWIDLKKQESLYIYKVVPIHIVDFWMKVRVLEDNKYLDLSELVLHMLSIPHGNASPERRFSEMNYRKSNIKNRKSNKTLNSEIHASQMNKILPNNATLKENIIKKIAAGRFYNNKYKQE